MFARVTVSYLTDEKTLRDMLDASWLIIALRASHREKKRTKKLKTAKEKGGCHSRE